MEDDRIEDFCRLTRDCAAGGCEPDERLDDCQEMQRKLVFFCGELKLVSTNPRGKGSQELDQGIEREEWIGSVI